MNIPLYFCFFVQLKQKRSKHLTISVVFLAWIRIQEKIPDPKEQGHQRSFMYSIWQVALKIRM